MPCLVRKGLREHAREPVRLAAAIRHVLGPRPWNPARRAADSASLRRRDLPIPASPSSRIVLPRPVDRQPSIAAARCRSSSTRPTSGAAAVRGTAHVSNPDARSTAYTWTEPGWPRSTTSPRSVTPIRSRAARTVASSRRISPWRAIAWSRAAVTIAGPVRRFSSSGPLPDSAATSPVEIPIRTSSDSSPPRSASAARIDSPHSAARIASSSRATGQPNTAKIASPMNFSRVPPSRSTCWAIGRKGVGDAGLDELGIMLGDHPDVVDDVREQRGDDSAIARRTPGAPTRPRGRIGRPPRAENRTDRRSVRSVPRRRRTTRKATWAGSRALRQIAERSRDRTQSSEPVQRARPPRSGLRRS